METHTAANDEMPMSTTCRGPVSWLGVAALALVLLAGAPAARANGRFPAAQYVIVGPGAASDTIALRATYGVLLSRDAGRTFRWLCEESIGYAGEYDPTLAMTADGALHVGIPDGLAQSRDACTFTLNPTLGTFLAADTSTDPAGERIVGADGNGGARNHLFFSDDRGRTFRRSASFLEPGWFQTVDVAPSDPRIVYATYQADATARPEFRLYRTTDDGATLPLVRTDFMGGRDAFLSGVDPTNPDRIWLRSNLVTLAGTMLLRSDDAGRTLRLMHTTMFRAAGFALSDDGQRVWFGGPDDGLLYSDNRGESFRQVSDVMVSCLRYHAGALYICADDRLDGFTLARWRDGAPAMEPLIRVRDVLGAMDCPAGTAAHDVCAARWPAQRAMFIYPERDAGTDARVDAQRDVASTMDAGLTDGGAAMDGQPADEQPRPGGGCRCRAGFVRGTDAPFAIVAVACAVVVSASRRRRRRSVTPRATRRLSAR